MTVMKMTAIALKYHEIFTMIKLGYIEDAKNQFITFFKMSEEDSEKTIQKIQKYYEERKT